MSTTTKTPTVTVTLAKFDTHEPYHTLREGQPISGYQNRPLTLADYSPRGGTPLRDATASFIAHLKKLRSPDTVTIGVLMDESGSMQGLEASVVSGINEFVGGMVATTPSPDAANTVLAVIFTDGYENSSREVSAEDLQRSIEAAEADGFTFIYLGANQDAWLVGRSTGFRGGVTAQNVNFAATPMGTSNALRSVTSDSAQYLAQGPRAYGQAMASVGRSERTIAEDGTETTRAPEPTIPDPPEPDPEPTPSTYGSIAKALETARKATS